MDTVSFRFKIKQDVKIIALDLPAKVMARCDRGDDVRDYRIVYWADCKRCDEWVYEFEIKEV